MEGCCRIKCPKCKVKHPDCKQDRKFAKIDLGQGADVLMSETPRPFEEEIESVKAELKPSFPTIAYLEKK